MKNMFDYIILLVISNVRIIYKFHQIYVIKNKFTFNKIRHEILSSQNK